MIRNSGRFQKGKPPKGRFRAGKRKCQRCKEIWDREKGSLAMLCFRCRIHCKRCDAKLTEETKSKGTQHQYTCKSCRTEITYEVRRNTGYDKRDYNLTRTFGITANEYDDILKSQDGKCWICKESPKEGQRRLAVDHLHSRGENQRNPREKRARCRGLLCWRCNRALGGFMDDITKLRRAADYLECWPAQKILQKENT